MANNPAQPSIFDDEALIDVALKNIELIKNKREIDPNSLNESERRFLTGIALMVDFEDNPIQPEKLVGKKVSPFSKMMMSAADVFSRAKKAFNIWMEKEPAFTKEEVQQVGPQAPTLAYKVKNKYNNINKAIGDKLHTASASINDSISNKLHGANTAMNNGVESVINGFNSRTAAVGEAMANGVGKVNSAIDKGVDKASETVVKIGDIIEQKKVNITERFMEIYDEVTIAKMKMQTAIDNKVDSAKNKYLAAKTSVAAFAEKFEEPWIKISFKGQESIPSLADISYNTGLYAAKAKNKFANALSGLMSGAENKKEEKVEPVVITPAFAMQNNDEPSIIGSKIVEPVAQEKVVETPDAEATVVESPVAEAYVEQEKVVENKVFNNIKNDDVIAKFKDYQIVGKEKRKEAYLEKNKSTVLEGVRSFLGLGGKKKIEKAPEYFGYEIDLTISRNEPPQFFKDLKTGDLPSRASVFKDTEERLKKNFGLSIAENGGYKVDYPKSLFVESKKIDHIKDDVVPHMLNEMKKSADFIFSLKTKQKEDSVLKVYDSLFAKTNDDNQAIEVLRQAKNSPEIRKELLSMGIDGMENFLNNVDESILKVEEHRYLTSLAEFDLAVVANTVTAVKLEVVQLSKEEYTVLSVNDKLDATQIMPSGATVGDLLKMVKSKDYSSILQADGNEDIIMRGHSDVMAEIAEKKFKLAENERLKEEKRVMAASTGSLAVDMISNASVAPSVVPPRKVKFSHELDGVDSEAIYQENMRNNKDVSKDISDYGMDSFKRRQGILAGGNMINPHTPDPRGAFTLHTSSTVLPSMKPPEYHISVKEFQPELTRVSTPDVVPNIERPVRPENKESEDSISLPSSDVRGQHFAATRTVIVPENKKHKP